MNYRGQFSVVIPTLQRSDDLHAVVELCAAHPLVAEVLVINNAPAPLEYGSGKVRVLDQGENIFVNPAWNLGALRRRSASLAPDDTEAAPRTDEDRSAPRADWTHVEPRREDYDRAAMTGCSELDRLDREAAARGEESQDAEAPE
ncbi:glycosyltransferase family 2 protein [Brachybacterium paraconglomeratum]|uniref:glycosyltransferase family 2 protein n=1 Tax=Brachybacterium paraconglomeratum TaxID=173362 RepID=UPI003F7B436A